MIFWAFLWSIAAGLPGNASDGPLSGTKHVLFICNGDYYRSRFAEAYLKFAADQLKLDVTVSSRGVKAWVHSGQTVSPLVLKELQGRGIPARYAEGHPEPLTYEDLRAADMVIAMSRTEQEPTITKITTGRAPVKIVYWQIADDRDACALLASRIDLLITQLKGNATPKLLDPVKEP